MYYHDHDGTAVRPTIVHLRTTITTTFIVVQGDNVAREIPLQVNVEKLDPELFTQAANVLMDHRQKLQADLDAGNLR
jgi:hypothetical protein